MQPIKPMLAGKVENATELEYPLLGSVKIDGIRCLTIRGRDGKTHAVTRNFKLLPNEATRLWIESNCPVGLDGEVTVSLEGKMADFSAISSAIMSEDGSPDFIYNVFDCVLSDTSTPFVQRLADLKMAASHLEKSGHLKIIPQIEIKTVNELNEFLSKSLEQGFEGIMVRTKLGPYKEGRSTWNEKFLLKLKLFEDSEAKIEGMIPLYHNANPAEADNFGLTERSSKKSGMVETDTLGALSVRDIKSGVQFEIGTGMSAAQRKGFWDNKENLIGKILKYKFQGTTGEKPRFPVFLSFRDPRDMS